MKYRKFLLHYVYRCAMMLTEILTGEETKEMKLFTQTLPDDLDDMIFLDEPWTHSER